MKISREENLQLTNDDNFRRIVREEEEVFSMADVGANICGKVSHYACRDVRIVVDRLPDLGQKMSQCPTKWLRLFELELPWQRPMS